MAEITSAPELELQILVTGSHLSFEAGHTVDEIIRDGFKPTIQVEMLENDDSPVGIAKSIGLGITGCAEAFEKLQPDLLLVLGDRFEIFAATTAALVARIPIVHIHGGEITFGSLDDQFRNAITKMSNVHCVSNATHRNRVIQMGEIPESVFLVGGLGIEAVQRTAFLSREVIEHEIGFHFAKINFMLTFHPETAMPDFGFENLSQILLALDKIPEASVLVSLPNADGGNASLREKLIEFSDKRSNVLAFDSLGQQMYLSCLAISDGLVGNSSSGLLEAPALGIGTVNVGTRQEGREKSKSVIDVIPEADHIQKALRDVCAEAFKLTSLKDREKFGNTRASEKIVEVLLSDFFSSWKQKRFFDLSEAE
jgi:GDP/UDP-N,N'-diacetylbacillosamine 2-epimerase (hydrolysing)